MRLVRVAVRNFRCYKEETSFDIRDLTILVGCNEAGKSSVLDALAIFFEEAKVEADDACIAGDAADVCIIAEFDDLPVQLVLDAQHPTTLKEEYLLNGSGHLELHKVYNAQLQTPKSSGVYAHALHPSAPGRDDLLSLKIGDLKTRAKQVGADTGQVDLTISSAIRHCIWESAPDLALVPTSIPLDKEAAKAIWEQLKDYLPSYALFKSDRPSTDQDAEAQDPMKAAIKEALKAQETDLDAITRRVEQEVKAIAQKTVEKLREMDPNLANELKPRFSTPNWAGVFKISLTDDNQVPINKRGSGVRRLILLNFFRAKAELRATEKGATNVIYAIEEPETSQHPNNQRILIQTLYDLSQDPDCQVILTTHTPTLARLVPADRLSYVCIQADGRRKVQSGSEETYQLVAKALGVLPDHNIRLFIGVEGPHDINFLKGLAKVLIQNGEGVIDLERLETEGKILFVPLGGSNLALWTSRLAGLNRPEFYLFDRDNEPPQSPKYDAQAAEINCRAGCKAFHTDKRELENYLHPDAIRAVRPEVTVSFEDFDDVPAVIAGAIHSVSGSQKQWKDLSHEERGKKESRAKGWLNVEAVSAMTPAMLEERRALDEVRGWFEMMQQVFEG